MEGKVEWFIEIIKHTVFLYSKHIGKKVAAQIGPEVKAQQDQRALIKAIQEVMEREFNLYFTIGVDELFREVTNDNLEDKVIGIELKAYLCIDLIKWTTNAKS